MIRKRIKEVLMTFAAAVLLLAAGPAWGQSKRLSPGVLLKNGDEMAGSVGVLIYIATPAFLDDDNDDHYIYAYDGHQSIKVAYSSQDSTLTLSLTDLDDYFQPYVFRRYAMGNGGWQYDGTTNSITFKTATVSTQLGVFAGAGRQDNPFLLAPVKDMAVGSVIANNEVVNFGDADVYFTTPCMWYQKSAYAWASGIRLVNIGGYSQGMASILFSEDISTRIDDQESEQSVWSEYARDAATKITVAAGSGTAEDPYRLDIEVSNCFTHHHIDLSTLTGDYTAVNGDTLFGTLDGATQPYKIYIATGSTVTLDGAVINGVDNSECLWGGLTVNGGGMSMIRLAEGSENRITGFNGDYPGIHVKPEATLYIMGNGSLTVESHGRGAGIGSGYHIDGGSIGIAEGTITATSLGGGAGIGAGENSSCGDIYIAGGTVRANGSGFGSGIGASVGSQVGDITIMEDVSKLNVKATVESDYVGSVATVGTVGVGYSISGPGGIVVVDTVILYDGEDYLNGSQDAGNPAYLFGKAFIYPYPVRLDSIPASWTVKADGEAVDVTAYTEGDTQQGYALIQKGAEVEIIPSDDDKPLVKSMELVVPIQTLDIMGRAFYYVAGETWEQAIANHPTENAAWRTSFMTVMRDSRYLADDECDAISPDAVVNPAVAYSLCDY